MRRVTLGSVALFGLLACILDLPSPTSSAKILVPVFFSSKSHKITYMRLLEELASRGHEITILSPVKPFGKPIKNIKEVYTFDTEAVMGHVNMFEDKEKGRPLNPFVMVDLMVRVCNASYDLPHVKEMIEKESDTFDLVFIQPFFNDCVFGWVHRIKAPIVLFTPTGAPSYLAEVVAGNHFPPSFTPSPMLQYSTEMTFVQRFLNFGMDIMIQLIARLVFEPQAAAIYREKLGDPSIPLPSQIMANASLILSNGHFSISGHKPLLPDVVDVGGIHSHPAKPLPKVFLNAYRYFV